MNSPLDLLKSDSLNRRELTFKALAGLCGGALGWLPVELASHNSHLGQAQTTGDMIAYYLSAAVAAGLIGAFITAVDTTEIRITPESQRRCRPWWPRCEPSFTNAWRRSHRTGCARCASAHSRPSGATSRLLRVTRTL